MKAAQLNFCPESGEEIRDVPTQHHYNVRPCPEKHKVNFNIAHAGQQSTTKI